MAAATYAQEYTVAFSGADVLRQRLACAIVDYAVNTVAAEGSTVTGHPARVSLATQALTQTTLISNQFLLPAIVLLGNAGNTAPLDADLKTIVGSLWNAMAGNV